MHTHTYTLTHTYIHTTTHTCAHKLTHVHTQPFLNCRWEEWAPCRNKGECEAAGECNDWDFYSHNSDDAGTENGGCVYKAPLNSDGWPMQCDQVASSVQDKTMNWNQVGKRAYVINFAATCKALHTG